MSELPDNVAGGATRRMRHAPTDFAGCQRKESTARPRFFSFSSLHLSTSAPASYNPRWRVSSSAPSRVVCGRRIAYRGFV